MAQSKGLAVTIAQRSHHKKQARGREHTRNGMRLLKIQRSPSPHSDSLLPTRLYFLVFPKPFYHTHTKPRLRRECSGKVSCTTQAAAFTAPIIYVTSFLFRDSHSIRNVQRIQVIHIKVFSVPHWPMMNLICCYFAQLTTIVPQLPNLYSMIWESLKILPHLCPA